MLDYTTARGMLKPEERAELASHIIGHRKAIINIGVEYGASMVCLAEHYSGHLLIGIDKTFERLEQDVKDELCDKAVWLLGDSHAPETLAWLRKTLEADNTPVALVFVDGDHSYDGALDDAMLYAPMIMPGGFIIFHDCYDWDHPEEPSKNSWVGGVGRAVIKWYNDNHGEWMDIGKVGTMREFMRRT